LYGPGRRRTTSSLLLNNGVGWDDGDVRICLGQFAIRCMYSGVYDSHHKDYAQVDKYGYYRVDPPQSQRQFRPGVIDRCEDKRHHILYLKISQALNLLNTAASRSSIFSSPNSGLSPGSLLIHLGLTIIVVRPIGRHPQNILVVPCLFTSENSPFHLIYRTAVPADMRRNKIMFNAKMMIPNTRSQ
jgi:hypothetical protein